MADPVTIAVVGTKAIGAIAGFSKRKKAKRALARAKRIQTVNKQLAFAQQRRQFIKAARSARAQALIEGIASGADLASSAVQGNLASLRTQEQVALTEFSSQEARNRQIEALGAQAGQQLAGAQQIEGITSFASGAIGDIFG